VSRRRGSPKNMMVIGWEEDGKTLRKLTRKEIATMSKRQKTDLGILKPVVGESVVQKTASAAGPHDKPKRKKRRQERREEKRKLQNGEFD
jgi:hypothetical protein